ncbi:MAG: Hsp70 family protein, partial [Planctomycetota bacterium]
MGIDLGTTNSVAAYVDHAGIPNSVVNFEGDIITPSKLLIEENAVVVGREAAKAAHTRASHYAESFKRYMGDDLFP